MDEMRRRQGIVFPADRQKSPAMCDLSPMAGDFFQISVGTISASFSAS